MYHRSQLEGFAAQIADSAQRSAFEQNVIQTIQFDDAGLCSGGELDRFASSELATLCGEFAERHLEFLTQENFEKIKSVFTGTPGEA
ncbi:MAG: hypothetical protein ABL890_01030 [Candidatus Peribacteraceae bacterium]